MTRERDIERVLDAWLTDGATQMPDRLYVAVLDRVDRTPQRRLARLKLRFSQMRPLIRVAAVAAVLLLTLGVGAAVVGGAFDSDAPGPTPAPSPAVSPSPAASPSESASADLPDELAHIWIGGERPAPALGMTLPVLHTLTFDPELGYARYVGVQLDLGPSIMASEPTVPSDGRLRLTIAGADATCQAGDVGDYDYRLSDGGMTMSLTLVSDDCQARGEVVAGTWTRSSCKNPADYCLGDVPAGSYLSTFLDVRTAPDGPVLNRGAYGQLRYTVPDGWANSEDWPDSHALEPADVVASNPASGDRETWRGIYVHARTGAAVQDEQCTDAEQPGGPRTLDGLTAYLQGLPGLEASDPVDLTIGGYRATMTDIAIAADWTQTCPDAFGGHPIVPLFHEAGTAEGWGWGIGWPGNTERQRVILVEIAPDNILHIGLDDTSSPSRFDELVAAAMPIVESFEFPE